MLDPNKILQIYKDKGYKYEIGRDVYNILYIEGINPDGTDNNRRINHWDDVRVVWQAYEDGSAKVLGAWDATTRPGKWFTHNPMNPKGAFQLALGQQTAWQVGWYNSHEVLRQVKSVTGTRDLNEDFERDGPDYTGIYGIHHHWGYDYPKSDISKSSAGCQVGRTRQGHRDFMSLIKKDRRYKEDDKFIFTSTVIPASWYLSNKGTAPAVVASTAVVAGTTAVIAVSQGDFNYAWIIPIAIAVGCTIAASTYWYFRRK